VKLHILAIGRLKGEAESSLVEDYLKRLRGLSRQAGMTRIDTREFPESRALTAAERMRAEASLLTEALPRDAVTIVLDDRKASADYLQQRLQIGYMRATDLIERMEREGILGAPVYNGLRPILIGGGGSREI